MHSMRRKDRQLEANEIKDILQKNKYGVLSTIGEDGYPYGVPLTYIYEDEKIYFHCAVEGHKLENISFSNKVSFCVVCDTEILPEQFSTRYQSVIAFGEIKELSENDKENILRKVVEKFSPDFLEKGANYIQAAKERARVFELKIEHITGKSRK